MANAEKVAAVAELTERFSGSSGAVLTEYRGLTVAQRAELRRSLADNATFAVVKNTLTKIAVTEAGLSDQLSSLLAGPSAIAFVDGDVVEAAKGLRDFSRANPLLVIKGGVLDGKAITPAEVIRLADVEPREVLLPSWPAHSRPPRPGRPGRSARSRRRWRSSLTRCAPSVKTPKRPGARQRRPPPTKADQATYRR